MSTILFYHDWLNYKQRNDVYYLGDDEERK